MPASKKKKDKTENCPRSATKPACLQAFKYFKYLLLPNPKRRGHPPCLAILMATATGALSLPALLSVLQSSLLSSIYLRNSSTTGTTHAGL